MNIKCNIILIFFYGYLFIYDDGSGWYYFVGHYVAPCEFNKKPVWIGTAVGDYDEYGGHIKYVHEVCDTDMWTQYENPDKYL